MLKNFNLEFLGEKASTFVQNIFVALQDQFFEVFLQKFTKNAEAIASISSLLSIGKDAAYRRLRGDSVLSPSEMSILAREYSISIDNLIFDHTEQAFFTVSFLANPIKKFDDFLDRLMAYLQLGTDTPEGKTTYATAEIPIFYYGMFPEIMCFKLYVWGKTVWNIDAAEKKPFSFDLFSPETMKKIKETNNSYLQMNSTELWCLNIFDNTLNQIEFVLSNGNFEKEEDALKICDALINFAKHVCKMAEAGKKFGPDKEPKTSDVPFELYHNELVFTNNTILFDSPSQKIVFSTFDSPNVIHCSDERVFNHTKNWVTGIKNKSEYISEVSEKNRNLYFNNLEKKVLKAKQRIKNFMETNE